MGSQTASGFTVPLESVICTRELNRRQPREPDFEAVTARFGDVGSDHGGFA